MNCDRCGAAATVVTGSWFNTDMICQTCDQAERAHPDFPAAKAAEYAACAAGNFNFPGIGLPDSLRQEADRRVK